MRDREDICFPLFISPLLLCEVQGVKVPRYLNICSIIHNLPSLTLLLSLDLALLEISECGDCCSRIGCKNIVIEFLMILRFDLEI